MKSNCLSKNPESFHEFRAYADLWRDVKYAYVLVRVFNTREAMNKQINELGFGPSGESCAGQCSGIEQYNKHGKLTGRFAVMWLNKEDLRDNGAEIVPHECVHAAMRHVNNRRVDISVMAGEEALAYTAGNLTKQINNKLHALGVWE